MKASVKALTRRAVTGKVRVDPRGNASPCLGLSCLFLPDKISTLHESVAEG
jgi:hypothetical protein